MDANAKIWKAMAREYRGILQRGVDITEWLFSWHDEDQMKIKELHAEMARLREALEEIGSGPCCETRPGDFDDPCCDVMVARAALSTPADDWLAQHDAEVRREERERIAVAAEMQAEFWKKRNQDISQAFENFAAAIRE